MLDPNDSIDPPIHEPVETIFLPIYLVPSLTLSIIGDVKSLIP